MEGVAKTLFDDYLIELGSHEAVHTTLTDIGCGHISKTCQRVPFDSLTDSMKWGVYLDFFDSEHVDVYSIYAFESKKISRKLGGKPAPRKDIQKATIEKGEETINERENA